MKRTAVAALALLAGCSTAQPAQKPEAPASASTNAHAASAPAPAAPVAQAPSAPDTRPVPAGVDLQAMDPAVSPCDDFFEYACGGWVKATPIPGDRGRWSRGFESIHGRNLDKQKQLLEDASAGKLSGTTPYAKLVGDFYAGCMDEPKLEASLPRLKKELAKVVVKSPKDLARLLATLHQGPSDGVFVFGSNQDYQDATLVVGELRQGGLGLPDRDYYLKDEDAKMKSVRDNYRAHVQKVFELLGEYPEHAQADAAKVLDVETQLARPQQTKVDERDPNKQFHRLERTGIKKIAPGFDWDAYFAGRGVPKVQQINVTHPPYFEALSALLGTIKPDAWTAYLQYHLVASNVLALPKAFQDEDFAFSSKNLTGAPSDKPRWKKCVEATDGQLGMALGQAFVAQYFPAESKARTLAMVNGVEAAFERNLAQVPWMDDQTRAKAVEKIKKISNKIGYPDKWRSYDGVKVDRAAFLDALFDTSRFETRRDVNKIGKPLDRTEWLMTPPTVNAYYNPPMNEIVFPAGILQPPFYDPQATDAVNFGAMGMVVGHEFTHGFDDEGRNYDADGNLKAWWTPTSDAAFNQRAACVKDQFDGYLAVDQVHVNGALTLGENVADLGGLKMAYGAMQDWLKQHPAATGARFTPEQQFYLGFAQAWCTKARPEFRRVRAVTDPHSPEFLRVNGPLGNSAEFAQAFSCKPGQKMVRERACQVW